MEKVIFTDLDGTLLDHDTYSYAAAKDALKIVKKQKIPLVFCTSKTRAEIEHYRKKFGNKDPFIVEDGGAIFIPTGYFDFEFKNDGKVGKYYVIELGTHYDRLLRVAEAMEKKFSLIKTFHDMTVKETAKDTGMTVAQSRRAKKREYDVVFKILKKDEVEKEILREIKKHKLNYVIGGRYYHIVGDNDKGKAVKILLKLFRKKFGKVKSIGLGDSQNDFSMLESVTVPYLVKKKSGRYSSKKYNHADGIGPKGWNRAVKKELE